MSITFDECLYFEFGENELTILKSNSGKYYITKQVLDGEDGFEVSKEFYEELKSIKEKSPIVLY